MSPFIVVVLYAILGGLWRRALGGWLGGPRWVRFGLLPVLTCPLWAVHWAAWGVVTLWLAIYWSAGHNFARLDALVARYGPVGLYWWLTAKYWPPEWKCGSFIDGPYAVAEFLAGATIFGMFTVIALV